MNRGLLAGKCIFFNVFEWIRQPIERVRRRRRGMGREDSCRLGRAQGFLPDLPGRRRGGPSVRSRIEGLLFRSAPRVSPLAETQFARFVRARYEPVRGFGSEGKLRLCPARLQESLS